MKMYADAVKRSLIKYSEQNDLYSRLVYFKNYVHPYRRTVSAVSGGRPDNPCIENVRTHLLNVFNANIKYSEIWQNKLE